MTEAIAKPDDVPLCECHGEPMWWNKQPPDRGYRAGGAWRCAVKAREWRRQRVLRRTPEEIERDRSYYRRRRLRVFGITEAGYEALLIFQGERCAICCGPPDTRWKRLAVDHDHQTGEVRGLLCMVCNTMLGRFEANRAAVLDYLGIAS